jgi:hypothetical protein
LSDFSIVTPRLTTGAALTNTDDVAALAAVGVTHVIDCRYDFDDAPLFAAHPDMVYLWNGTSDDGTQKPDSWFQTSLDFAVQALSKPHAMLHAHCAAGVNRGPSTTYLILRGLSGIAPELADKIIRDARPQVGLLYAQQADDFLERVVFYS